MALKENYKDDILDVSVNTKRKYRMTENADGTISLDDETVYTQEGDSFGASDMNATNGKVNALETDIGEINDNLLGLTSQMSALKNWHISQAYTGNNNQIALSKSKDEYSFIGAMISTDTGTSDNGEVLQGIIIIPTSIFTSYTFKTLRVGAHDNSSVQMKYVDDTHIKMDVDSGKKGRYILID